MVRGGLDEENGKCGVRRIENALLSLSLYVGLMG
jgi:hypothetical protein